MTSWVALCNGVGVEIYDLHFYCHNVCPLTIGELQYNAQSPDEGALVGATKTFGYVFKVSTQSNPVAIDCLYGFCVTSICASQCVGVQLHILTLLLIICRVVLHLASRCITCTLTKRCVDKIY